MGRRGEGGGAPGTWGDDRMNRDLSLRGILSEWVREVVGIEGRLPRSLLPGDGDRH